MVAGGPCGSFAGRSAASDVLFWQPLDVPGFVLDLNPAFKFTLGVDVTRVTCTSLTNNVPLATDQFANGNPSLSPTYQFTGWGGAYNLPALLFNGLSQFLLCTSGLAASMAGGNDKPFSLFLVCQNLDLTGVRCLLGFFSATANNPLWDFFTSAGANATFRRDDAGGNQAQTGGVPTSAKMIVTMLFLGTTVTIKINGVTVINNAPQNVGVITFTVMCLASTYGLVGPNNWANILFGRLLGFGAISPSDEAYVYQNLNAIYLS